MFRKILVPVDGSEHSEKALSLVEELASKFGSEVLVFHVREKSVGRGGSWDVDLTEEDINVAEEAAQRLAEKGVNAKSEAVCVARTCRPKHRPSSRRQRRGCDHDGVPGSLKWSGLLVGSVTHKVLHMSPCPIIVVR